MLERNIALHELMVKVVGLRFPAVALKIIEDEAEVPEGAISPLKDWGKHIAICQAFAFARREGKIIYMKKEDHWCWNPILTYGIIDKEVGRAGFHAMHKAMGRDTASGDAFVDSFPYLPYGKTKGILIAPLNKADFEPDVTMIYCKNDQLRLFLMGLDTQRPELLESSFKAIDSCTYAVIPAILNGNYRITLPDPGEYERALTPEDDIILSVPAPKIEQFTNALNAQLKFGARDHFFPIMKEDFPRPSIYNILFEAWGLDLGDDENKTI